MSEKKIDNVAKGELGSVQQQTASDLVEAPDVQTEVPRKTKRKPKMSRLCPSYDPTPDYDARPNGKERPSVSCWVNPSLAKPLKLGELHPLWRADVSAMGTKQRKERFLASKIVLSCGEYFVKVKADGRWVQRARKEVKALILNDWGRDITEFHVGAETVDDFLADSELIVLDGTAYIPGAGEFVRVQGRNCLNTWSQRPALFTPGASDTNEFKLLLEMIVRNLVGHDEGSPEEWIAEIGGTTDTPLRWFFHWIASNYQRPGNRVPTAMWIAGRNQGVGKGLFAQVMRTLMGTTNVNQISVEEFKSDWTDWLAGAALHIGDEIDLTQRKEFYDRTKRIIGNEKWSVRKRHEGASEVPAVANFIFTTNDVSPLNLDSTDRRHTFFETLAGQEAKDLAKAYYDLGPEGRRIATEGLAELLAAIDIDGNLISNAIMTDLKREIIDMSGTPVEQWLETDGMVKDWPVGYFTTSEFLTERYSQWASERALLPAQKTTSYCKRTLRNLEGTGTISRQVRRTMADGSKRRGYIRIDPEFGSDYGNVADLPVAPPARKKASAKIIEMQKHIRKAREDVRLVS